MIVFLILLEIYAICLNIVFSSKIALVEIYNCCALNLNLMVVIAIKVNWKFIPKYIACISSNKMGGTSS